MRDFFTVLAVCNTVVVSLTGQHRSRVESLPFMGASFSVSDDYISKLKYEAESPDEAALVKVGLIKPYITFILVKKIHVYSIVLREIY